jgi:two-component system phosphate regulon sensor histidine kinase PhoR
MPQYRWFLRPVSIFIFSLCALIASLFIYIRSYLNVNEAFEKFLQVNNFTNDQFARPETWVTILTLSILVAIILVGLVLVFITYQRAVELYRMQQNFINGFTHELKTPIASIRLYVDTFLKHDLEPAKQKQYLQYMLEDTDRLSTNVEQILSLGKLEERNYQLKLEHIDLVDLIERLVAETSHRFEEGEIEFDGKGIEGVDINIDESLFTILLSNIINNGFYHNLSKEPLVKILGRNQGSGVAVIIEDNGVGIDPKFAKKIFKKFFQIGKSVKGSGLGLYMCQIIAKFHNIKINVEAKTEDQGTRFIIEIPGNRTFKNRRGSV